MPQGTKDSAPTLTDFLLARIAEDEGVARDCAEVFPTPWEIADRGWRVRIYASEVPEPDYSSDDEDAMSVRSPVVMEVEPDRNLDDPRWLSERVAHIARHDPARVLAECEAKRRIVESFAAGEPYQRGTDSYAITRMVYRLLALPYADHPDYREEWKP